MINNLVTLFLNNEGKTLFTCPCANAEIAFELGEKWNSISLSHTYTIQYESEEF